jgi:hypothetical protein
VPAILHLGLIGNPGRGHGGSLLLGLINPTTLLVIPVTRELIGRTTAGINSISYIIGMMYQLCGIFSVRIIPAFTDLT